MKIDLENLPTSIEELQKIIFLQKQEIADYKDRYVRLLEKIKLERVRIFSPSSEKNIHQTDLFDEPGVELPEEIKDQLDDEIEVKSHVRKKHPVRRLLPDYLPREVQPSIVYEYQETRGDYHAQQFLAGFKGYLQSDAFSGYNWADDAKEIIHVGCHAHARRPFAEIAKTHKTSGLAHEGLKFYRKLYAIEKEAREEQYTAEERHKLRQERSIPVLSAFKKWLDHHITKTSEQGAIGKAIRYCLAHWSELNNYLEDGRIEIDNNLVENAIRPFALGRKNWLFNGSPSGAKAGAIFFSLIETCKANNIEPYKCLCAMLNRIRQCVTEDNYSKLLPQFI